MRPCKLVFARQRTGHRQVQVSCAARMGGVGLRIRAGF